MADPVREFDSPRMSEQEYLAFEEASDVRHEYVDGYVYAMSGPTSRHERIVGNVFGHLWARARGGPCRAYASSLKVRTPSGRIYYPDAMTVCTPRDDDALIVTDPCFLLEVISPSSVRIDRHEKQAAYAEIPTLRSYMVADQRRRQVDHWTRDESGEWRHVTVIEQGDVTVPCPVATLTLVEIYEGVVLQSIDLRRVREPEAAFEPG